MREKYRVLPTRVWGSPHRLLYAASCEEGADAGHRIVRDAAESGPRLAGPRSSLGYGEEPRGRVGGNGEGWGMGVPRVQGGWGGL